MSSFIRRLIKTGMASTLHWSGANELLARRASVRQIPLVLGYHRVVEDFEKSSVNSIPAMLTSLKTFERQVDWIGRYYDFVGLEDLADLVDGSKRLNSRPVAAITFDDGYADLYHHAFPLLQKKGIPSAVFVVAELAKSSRLQIYDELYLLLSGIVPRWRNSRQTLGQLLVELDISDRAFKVINVNVQNQQYITGKLIDNLPQADLLRVVAALRTQVEISDSAIQDLRTMNWDMLREVSGMGVTVGAHTRTHPNLTLESPEKLIDEIRGSRLDTEQELGMPVDHFAYPYGIFNANVVNAVAEAGFRCAYTTCQHRDNRYPGLTIPRRLWWENSGADIFRHLSPPVMSSQVSGAFDFVACRLSHGQ